MVLKVAHRCVPVNSPYFRIEGGYGLLTPEGDLEYNQPEMPLDPERADAASVRKGSRGVLNRSVSLTFVLVVILMGVTSRSAMVRPEIRRSFDLVDNRNHRNIYRINVQVVNGDSLPLSVLYVPYDQIEWHWSHPHLEEYASSFMDISGSARAGTGVWRELEPAEVWYPPSDRIWAADCELGGVEKGAVLDFVFFAEVAETVKMNGKPIRIGCGTCGQESFGRSDRYWASVSQLLLRRIGHYGVVERYRYVGCADTLVLQDIDAARVEEVGDGWSLLSHEDGRIILVRDAGAGAVEFALRSEHRRTTTGLLSWEGRWEGVSHGFVFGPGTAEYSILRSLDLVREPGWSKLLQGFSVTFLFAALMVVFLRARKRTKR